MPRTEDLEVRILRELTSPSSFQWNFRESYSEMGRRLGADSETVRTTLARAIKMGLVEKWRLVINPDLFGLKLAGMQLDVRDQKTKPRVISQIRLIEGVVDVFDFHGPDLRTVMYYDTEAGLQRKAELVGSMCDNTESAVVWHSELPPCRMKLRRSDWQIIQSVMHDPRKDASIVAEEVGLSRRTVNRRLKMMSNDRVAYLIPVRDVRKSRGTICCFLIRCSEGGRTATREYLQKRALRIDFLFDSWKGVFLLTLVTNNILEGNELREELEKIAGVSQVKLGFLKEFAFVEGWLDQMVAVRAGEK